MLTMLQTRRLFSYEGANALPDATTIIEESSRSFPPVSISVSRNDKYVAFTLNDQVRAYRLGMHNIRRIHISGQMETYELPNHFIQNSTIKLDGKKALSHKDAEQEAHRQNAVIERKLAFSVDGEKLIIATHLADHHVYLDVWDCTAEPWTIKPEHSRSFKLPPVSIALPLRSSGIGYLSPPNYPSFYLHVIVDNKRWRSDMCFL
jgi:hypothetical protein